MQPDRSSAPARRPGWDALLLAFLVIARLRVNSFAEAGLFEHFQNVTTHPFWGNLLSEQAEAAFGPWFGDPIALLLAAMSIGALIAYLVADLVGSRDRGLGAGGWEPEAESRWRSRVKTGLVWTIIAFTVLIPTLKLATLRHENLPHSYSHDGGVIQTEATIDYFLSGKNPYIEDYRSTPMAEWGLEEFRTALDHYPYLPWTFVASAPVKLISDALLGWYDQRFVYLIVFRVGADPGDPSGGARAYALAAGLADAAGPQPDHGSRPHLRPERSLRLVLDRPRLLAPGACWFIFGVSKPITDYRSPITGSPIRRRLWPRLRQQTNRLVPGAFFCTVIGTRPARTRGATFRVRFQQC